jgi:hypothetical protein
VSAMIYFKAYCVGCTAYFARGKKRVCETRSTLTGHLRCRSRVNMAAPLPVRTNEGQRAVIRYIWVASAPGPELHHRL